MTKNNYNIGGDWLLIQCALLVIHYGFGKTLPWWVLWLPSLLTGCILGVVIVVLIVVALVTLIMECLD